MSRLASLPATDRDFPRLGLVDAAILAVSFALGIWVWAIDSTELERVLGLGNHEAQFEAMVNAGRSRLDNLAPNQA